MQLLFWQRYYIRTLFYLDDQNCACTELMINVIVMFYYIVLRKKLAAVKIAWLQELHMCQIWCCLFYLLCLFIFARVHARLLLCLFQ